MVISLRVTTAMRVAGSSVEIFCFNLVKQAFRSQLDHIEDPGEPVARSVIRIRHVRDLRFRCIVHEHSDSCLQVGRAGAAHRGVMAGIHRHEEVKFLKVAGADGACPLIAYVDAPG